MPIHHNNVFSIGAPQQRFIDNHDHLVLPVVMIKEGVMNAVYYPESELSFLAHSWNGVPVTINHPKDAKGEYCSARSPHMEDANNIGRIYNVEYDETNKQLAGEVWIDVMKAQRLGHELVVMQLRNASVPMEVSTGLYCEQDLAPGKHNGKPYMSIARTIHPDHLALLPNDEGACSVKDGCGVPRTNCDAGQTSIANELQSLMTSAKLFFSKFMSEEPSMNKAKVIDGIIANKANQFVEKDKAFLAGLQDEQLKKLMPNEEAKEPVYNVETVTLSKEEWAAMEKSEAENAVKLNKEDKVLFDQLKFEAKQRRDELIAHVIKENPELESTVNDLPIDVLTALAKKTKTGAAIANYSGQAGAMTESDKESAYTPPSILMARNLDKKGETSNGQK